MPELIIKNDITEKESSVYQEESLYIPLAFWISIGANNAYPFICCDHFLDR